MVKSQGFYEVNFFEASQRCQSTLHNMLSTLCLLLLKRWWHHSLL